MKVLLLLLLTLHISNAALPKELIILSRGLVYPKPIFERVEMLRDICEEKRDAFFHPFRGNLTKKEIKEELSVWAVEMEKDGHNGTDDSVRALVLHWEQWRKETEDKVFSLLKETKIVYREIVSNSSHCTSNLSLCQDTFDLLPPRLHQALSFLTAGGIQLSRSPRPSNHSFTPPPHFNFTHIPTHNWTIADWNGTRPQWNGTLTGGMNGTHLMDSSEETDLIEEIEREEETFSFGNLAVYEKWFNYWMEGTMNTANWNTTRDAIMEWKNGNYSILPRFPTGIMASVVLPNERNWTLSVLDALNRGIEGGSRVGQTVDSPLQVSTAVSDLSLLFSSVTDHFKGNLVEGYTSPLLRSPVSTLNTSASHTAISPVNWSSIAGKLAEMSSVNGNMSNWLREAQLMYETMASLGITDELMGYLDSLHASSRHNSSRGVRVERSPLTDASGSRIDLIFGHSEDSLSTPSPLPSPPSLPSSLSSLLSGTGSMIGEGMEELEKMGSGLVSQVINALANHTVPNIASISQLPSTLLSNSSLPSWIDNLSGFLSNATSIIQNMTYSLPPLPHNSSSVIDFSTGLINGSMNAPVLSSTSPPSLSVGSKDLMNIISSIFNNMDTVTYPPEEQTTFSDQETTERATGYSSEEVTERPSSIRVSTTVNGSLVPSFSSLSPVALSLPPFLPPSTVPHSPLPSSIPPSSLPSSTVPSPSPSVSSLPLSSSTSRAPTNFTDLTDILKGNGFNVPDIKNLSSVVESIDRLNEYLSNRTMSMIDTITRTIEEAFRIGESRENMMSAVNATIHEAKEIVNNITSSMGVMPVASWSDIKNHFGMPSIPVNVSRDDYEYVEYDGEEIEEMQPPRGNDNGTSGMEGGNSTIPTTNVTQISEEDEIIMSNTLVFYDKMNSTLSLLFSIVANESLSIPDTKRALNAVYWNSTLIQRKMITFLIRSAEIPSIDIEEGVTLSGPCSNDTLSLSLPSRPFHTDETSQLLMA